VSVAVLHPSGRLDARRHQGTTGELRTHLQSGRLCVVVDLSAVEDISSVAARALLGAIQQIRAAGGDVRLAAPRASLRDLLSFTALATVVQVYANVDAAVGSFKPT
jgi:anti-anti-sigma factor